MSKLAAHTGALSCSFCGRSEHEVKTLIAGQVVYICDLCIELCHDIVAEGLDPDRRPGPSWADARDVSMAIQTVGKDLRASWVVAAQDVVGRIHELAAGLDKVSSVIDVRLLPKWPPETDRLHAVSRALSSAASELRDQAPSPGREVISSIRELADRVDALAAKLPTLLAPTAEPQSSSEEATSDRGH